jgi:hypothetical protein
MTGRRRAATAKGTGTGDKRATKGPSKSPAAGTGERPVEDSRPRTRGQAGQGDSALGAVLDANPAEPEADEPMKAKEEGHTGKEGEQEKAKEEEASTAPLPEKVRCAL